MTMGDMSSMMGGMGLPWLLVLVAVALVIAAAIKLPVLRQARQGLMGGPRPCPLARSVVFMADVGPRFGKTHLRADNEPSHRLAKALLMLYRRAVIAQETVVAELLLCVLETLSKSDPACAAQRNRAYLSIGAESGAAAAKYIDAFFQNIQWERIAQRLGA